MESKLTSEWWDSNSN